MRDVLHSIRRLGLLLLPLMAAPPLRAQTLSDAPSANLVTRLYASSTAQREGWQRLARWTAQLQRRETEGLRSARDLLTLMRMRDSAIVESVRQNGYLNLRSMRDNRDTAAAATLDSLAPLAAAGSSAASRALAAVPSATLESWLRTSPALRAYAYAISDDRRTFGQSSHAGARDSLEQFTTGWQPRLYQQLIDRTHFGFVHQGGDSLDVWRQRGAIGSSPDRRVRQEGFDKLYAGFRQERDLYASTLIGTVTSRNALARLRGFPDAPAEGYHARYLTSPAVRSLIGRVRDRAGLYRRYLSDRVRFIEQALHIPRAGPWDLGAPVGMEAPRFSLDSARAVMRAALAPFGAAYATELDSLLEPSSGALDVGPGPHRVGGGTSIGFPGTAVGVYLPGYEGYYSDFSRLVHESGHAMQTRMMARGGVLPANAAGPNYLAEAVALFNELVVADYLEKHATAPSARRFFAERFLAKAFEVVLGAQDADLEQTVYDSVAAGRLTTADDLDSLSTRVLEPYTVWDPNSPQRREQWVYARLMYEDPLYLMNYMYSGMIAVSLFQKYQSDPAGFARRYVSFLMDGYIAAPPALLARLGIDLSDGSLLDSDFRTLSTRVEQLETLQAETLGARAPTSRIELDYAAGRRLLDAAITASGDSAALAALGGLTTSFCARAVEIGQSAAPDSPYDTIGASGLRTYDLRSRRYAQTWSTVFRGGLPLALREVVTDSAATSLDLRGGVVMSVVPGGIAASQRRVEDNAPYAPLVLLQRARRAAPSIRIVRAAAGDSASDALAFVDGGQLVTLRFDHRTHLLASAEMLFDNWAFGLTPLEIQFSDYRRLGRVELARHVVSRFHQGLLTDVVFPDLEVAQAGNDAFNQPRDRAGAVPIGGPIHLTIDTVAPRVFVVRDGQTFAPNFGYNAPFAYARLLVELRDRLLMVDAAGPSSTQQAIMDKVRAMFPAKRIALLAFTHYHGDHFGGLRPWLAAGTTMITTPGNRALIERVAGLRHPSDATDPAGISPPAPTIETFTGMRVVEDSDAPVELHEIGGGHADEMVVAYLPRQGVLFATDVFGILPARGAPGGTYAAEGELARYARARGWTVRTVVAGHGPVSSGAALESALTSTPAPPRPVEVAACRGPSGDQRAAISRPRSGGE